jgi:2-polyprenyl-3-methyl-5-hydroxy-6-metoxy-1,4-benzoquinol methylase
MLNNQPIYDPSIFDQVNIDNAREVTLTSESGISTQTRWDSETPWLLNLVRQHIKQSGLIIDFGCGIGRLAGPLVEQGFPVIGIDSSDLMRQHATKLIANDRFVAMTSSMLDQLINIGVKADSVLAIWMLQHCLDLEGEILRINRMINKGGIIGIADMRHRAVPTDQGWRNDGKSVKDTMCNFFTLIQQYPYNPPNAPKDLRENAYIAFFRKDR